MQQAQALQSSINTLQNTIKADYATIQEHQHTLAELQKEQQQLSAKQQEDIQTLGNYLRTEYEQGDSLSATYFNLLINAKSFNDLLSRTTYIGSIINFYTNLKAEIAANSKQLQLQQQNEQAVTAQLNQTTQSKLQMENSLNSALAKKKAFISSLTTAQQETLAAQSQAQNNIDETERLIAAQEREAELAAEAKSRQEQAAQEAADQAMGRLSTPAKLNGSMGQLLGFAESFLGTPYVWGGTTPKPGFDCSGYVQYVYAHFGINLYRVTWDQFTEGQSVSKADLEPGDLVFFSTYAPGASHVGIYIGNHMMIDSSDYGVAYDSIDYPYWAARYIGARRVAN